MSGKKVHFAQNKEYIITQIEADICTQKTSKKYVNSWCIFVCVCLSVSSYFPCYPWDTVLRSTGPSGH